jgi:hypothetical protein
MDPSPAPPSAPNLSPPFEGQNLGTDLFGRPMKKKPDDDKDKLKTTTTVFAQMITVLKFVDIQRIITTSGSDKWSKKYDTMDHHLTSLLSA